MVLLVEDSRVDSAWSEYSVKGVCLFAGLVGELPVVDHFPVDLFSPPGRQVRHVRAIFTLLLFWLESNGDVEVIQQRV